MAGRLAGTTSSEQHGCLTYLFKRGCLQGADMESFVQVNALLELNRIKTADDGRSELTL